MMWLIYFVGMVDNLIAFLQVICILSGICTAISLILFIASRLDSNFPFDAGVKFIKKFFISTMAIFLIISSLCIFIPNSQTMAAMYLVPKIMENESIKNIPNKALNIMELKLDKWIEDLSGDIPKPIKEN